MEDTWWQVLSLGFCGESRENYGLEPGEFPKFRLWKITETLRAGSRIPGERRPGWSRVRLGKVLGLYSPLPSHPDTHAMCVSQQS